MHSILIVEADDHALSRRGDELLLDGYEVLAARTTHQAQNKLTEDQPDALVLGALDSPVASLALLRQLRGGEISRADPRLPVLAIGADSDHGAARFYQAGADIALPSTASPLLIKGALDALAARAAGEHQRRRVLRCGGLSVDCDARVASIDSTPIALTRLEFDLLQTLAGAPQRTFTKAQLTQDVWGYDPAVAGVSRTVDSHVISSPVWGVGCVDCWFCPSRRRRFISSGVDSALAAVLSPRAKRRGVGAARLSTPPRHRSLSVDFLTYRPSGRVAGWA